MQRGRWILTHLALPTYTLLVGIVTWGVVVMDWTPALSLVLLLPLYAVALLQPGPMARALLPPFAISIFVMALTTPGARGGRTFLELLIVMALASGGSELLIWLMSSRAEVDAARRESELRYQQMFWRSQAIKLLVDPGPATIVDANPAACLYYGQSREELTGKPLTALHSDSYAGLLQLLSQARESPCPPFTASHQSPSGEARNVELYCTPIEVEGRTLVYTIVHDVSQRSAAEFQLHQQLAFEALVTEVSTRFINLPPDRIGEEVARALYAVSDFTGMDRAYLVLYHEERRHVERSHLWESEGLTESPPPARPLPVGRLSWWLNQLREMETLLIEDVSDLPAEARAELALLTAPDTRSQIVVPLAHNRSLRGFLAFDGVRESRQWSKNQLALFKILGEILITAIEWQRSHRALATQRSFALQVMNTMEQGVAVTDAEGRLDYVNPALSRLLGYPPANLIGRRLDGLIEANGRLRASATEPGEGHRYESRLRRADGEALTVMVAGVPRDAANPAAGTISVVTDLTAQREIESSLAGARDEALAVSRLKSIFLATVSHEIRTPMNAIIGTTELLAATELDENQRSLVQIASSAAGGLLVLLNDILDLSKIEAGRLELDEEPFALEEVVEEAAALLGPRARENELSLTAYVAPPLRRTLRGDAYRLRQVLVNLISNAVKFTPAGEITVRALPVEMDGESLLARFEVRDSGVGIEAQARDRLFQPFAQADASTTRRYGGTGLGLAISKHLVDEMGGEIGFDSEVGCGTTFYFTARLRIESASDTPADPPALAPDGTQVLLVTPADEARDLLARVLSEWGADVASVADGRSALDWLRRESATLVLTAGYLPDMAGLDLARAVRRQGSAPPPVGLLASSERLTEVDERLALLLPMPFPRHRLLEQLEGLLHPDLAPVAPVTPPAPTRIVGERYRILLAEDNLVNQQVALRQLRALGHATDVVGNGLAAIETLQAEPETYDILLMDCHMPVLDGFEAARAIREAERESGRHLPIVAMTANAMPGFRESCLEAGMDDYLSKPVRLDALRAVLERWLPDQPRHRRAAPPPAAAESPLAMIRDVLDTSTLEEIFHESDVEPFMELMALFISDAERQMKALVLAVTTDTPDQAYRAAHALKGNAATFGANRLAALSRAVERHGREGHLAAVEPLIGEMEEELARVRAAVSRLEGTVAAD